MATKDPIAALAESIVGNFKQSKPFANIYGTLQKYLQTQLPLAEQGVAQQTNKYFLPQIDEGIDQTRAVLAKRGLFRSGIRGAEERKFLTNIADEEATQRESLLTNRANELRARYAKLQSDYEKTTQTGGKYKAPADFQAPVVVNPAFAPTGPALGDRYSPISEYQGTDSTSKYGATYKKWFEDRYKKARPDVSYNIM